MSTVTFPPWHQPMDEPLKYRKGEICTHNGFEYKIVRVKKTELEISLDLELLTLVPPE